ncbi:hypothetical protein C1637_01945 [Chryseobacterium lactis]|uniref:Anti-sigma factor n=1 Tax=Chryseobacterium lactis TaxID=1241981 RepID=A0A3G6RPX6_CHRLC|nr:hypothetical protein [Chryseobacterium lactis]AZA81359.1 hypothetical protein EG342_05330 [Chryseobacterium lactis]AZB06358.1 hypothetical protein EG341_21455 [Chryseobacterium lactis]PNW15211.1 hypothetical protein C1637_01945 [Chryseobacterium lactis]
MKEFDIEKLERKNIYTVPDKLFESIQDSVMNDIKTDTKAPVFRLNWMYAAAASLALIFGVTYVFNSDNNNSVEEGLNSKTTIASQKGEPKSESEVAYETLKADLTSVENNNQTVENQKNNSTYAYKSENGIEKAADSPKPVKTAPKKEDTRMNEYLDSFSNSEIAELASNSTQDVYLDLYN